MKKINAKQIIGSLLMFLVGFVCLCASIMLMSYIRWGDGAIPYVRQHVNETSLIVATLFVLSIICYLYILFEDSPLLKKPIRIIELFIVILLALAFSFLMGEYVDPNARPIAFLPLMILTLFGRKESIFITGVYALMQFLMDKYTGLFVVSDFESYACLVSTFCTGTISIFFAQNLRSRIKTVGLIFVIIIPIEFIIAMLEVLTSSPEQSNLGILFLWGAVASAGSVLLYMLFLPIFEAIFSELTVFRLRELTSEDSPLLKRLKKEAPGTYNHSVVVAQLVEACAREIGEDVELARAAAYYHDVGKLKNPAMFTENQLDGVNLHNELTPELSVDIIRSHAKDGASIIKKYHLPDFFAQIAVQHHGTLPIKYFYAKALKMSDGDVDLSAYCYAGPTPASKIAAIIMVADASEAAARSVNSRDVSTIESIVRGIIEERMDMEQFDNCNITFAELGIIRRVIVQQLSGVHHGRVAYPKLKIKKD